jgi:hypothetical protein
VSLYADITTALKAITAFGDRVGLDTVAEGETFPYVTFAPEIDSQLDLEGDSLVLAYRQTFQVDLWEEAAAESIALRDEVRTALDGLQVTKPALRFRVQSWVRVPDPDPGVIHRAFTVGVVELT